MWCYLTLYVLPATQSTTQLPVALFVRVRVTLLHKSIQSILRLAVCESRANQALTQARSIDTLHLTRFAIGIQWDPTADTHDVMENSDRFSVDLTYIRSP